MTWKQGFSKAKLRNAFLAVCALALSNCAASAQSIITTVTGGGGLSPGPATTTLIGPSAGVAIDQFGNVFFASPYHEVVYRVTPSGQLSIAAGIGPPQGNFHQGDGGPATSAMLAFPTSVAVDSAGNLFIGGVGDVRRVDGVTGLITTVAGGACCSLGDGGPATSAHLNAYGGLAFDSAGNLLIGDELGNRIRLVNMSTGLITTVVGNGVAGFSGDGGPATSAMVSQPTDVKVDAAGNILVADSGNGRVRRIDAATGIITTVAGGGCCSLGDGGPATGAQLSVAGLALDRSSDLYIADGFSRIRFISASTGIITTVAGNGVAGFSGDGGPATNASVQFPRGVALDANQNLFIGDYGNSVVRRVDAITLTISTYAGKQSLGDGGPGVSAVLALPSGVAADPAGNLFIADGGSNRVRKVDASSGVISTVAGNGNYGSSGDGGPAPSASLSIPSGVARDSLGNIFIADQRGVRRVDSVTGNITTVAAQPGVIAIAVDTSDNLFIAQISQVKRVDAASGILSVVAGNGQFGFSGDGGPATAASLNFVFSIGLDVAGNLFIVDVGNNRIRRVDATTGIITTVAGNGTSGSAGDGGPATSASLALFGGIALDGAGNLFLSEAAKIRRVDAITGIITTIAGNGIFAFSGDGGPAISASLVGGPGLAFDGVGNLFSVGEDNRVRRITGVGVPSQPTCTFLLSPTGQSIGSQGGLSSFAVNTAPTCSWFATTNASWISIVSGGECLQPIVGGLPGPVPCHVGAGKVTFAVARNTGASRSGNISVGNQTFKVNQAALPPVCTFTISPTHTAFSDSGGNSTIAVTVPTGASCTWVANTNAPWLSILSGASGKGNGSLVLHAARNAGVTRTGTVTIAGQTFTATQSGFGTNACGAVDVTLEVGINRSQLTPVDPLGLLEWQSIVVNNTSGRTIRGPLYLVFVGLPTRPPNDVVFVVKNPSLTHCFSSQGDTISLMDALDLPTGQSTGFLPLFEKQNWYDPIRYTLKVLSGKPTQ